MFKWFGMGLLVMWVRLEWSNWCWDVRFVIRVVVLGLWFRWFWILCCWVVLSVLLMKVCRFFLMMVVGRDDLFILFFVGCLFFCCGLLGWIFCWGCVVVVCGFGLVLIWWFWLGCLGFWLFLCSLGFWLRLVGWCCVDLLVVLLVFVLVLCELCGVFG